MTKIGYYKTTKEKLPKAFCNLAEKCYHNNISLFVYTSNETSMYELDKLLWTYSKKQFIPHGTIHDSYQDKQPILLGNNFTNLNNASSMIIINASEPEILSILSSINECNRLFFLYDDEKIASDIKIKNILNISALKNFTFESYTQADNNHWVIKSNINI